MTHLRQIYALFVRAQLNYLFKCWTFIASMRLKTYCANFLRQAVLPPAVRHWTLTTLREKPVIVGARNLRFARMGNRLQSIHQ